MVTRINPEAELAAALREFHPGEDALLLMRGTPPERQTKIVRLAKALNEALNDVERAKRPFAMN